MCEGSSVLMKVCPVRFRVVCECVRQWQVWCVGVGNDSVGEWAVSLLELVLRVMWVFLMFS